MQDLHLRAARSMITDLHAAGWDADSVRGWCVKQGFQVSAADVQRVFDDLCKTDRRDETMSERSPTDAD